MTCARAPGTPSRSARPTAIQRAADTGYGLASSVCTDDLGREGGARGIDEYLDVRLGGLVVP